MSARKQNSIMHQLVKIFIPHRHNGYKPWIGRIPGLFTVTLLLVVAHVFLNGINTSIITVEPANNTTKNTDLLENINSERARNETGALKIDDRLERAAQAKAEHMLAEQYWAHVSPTGLEAWSFIQKEKYLYRESAENLARGFNTAEGVVAGWQASEAHRNAMLNHEYKEVGFGVVRGNLLGENTTVVVALFADPLEGAALSTAQNAKNSLLLQGKSAQFITNADAVQFSLLNPISLHSSLTLPGKVALITLFALALIYLSQHILIKKKRISWNPQFQEHPIVRLVIVIGIMLLIVLTSFGSVN